MAKRGRTVGVLGNIIVAGILILGGWLVWRNATRSSDPPSPGVAILAETAEQAGAEPGGGAPRRRTRADPASLVVAPSGLAIPVAGVKAGDLVDTFTQSRAGGARVHNAIDIMAPRGVPVVSASEGTVEKLYFSRGGGGITAYVRSPDGQWLHYYAHLDSYAPTLREGLRLRRGDPIGTVGISGNANPSGPHLHYAIYRMAPGERWYQGTPVNPYPLLAGRGTSR